MCIDDTYIDSLTENRTVTLGNNVRISFLYNVSKVDISSEHTEDLKVLCKLSL